MVVLACLALLPAVADFSTRIQIDARKQTPISPYIYGVNYPDTWIYDWLADWDKYHDGFTLAREGGNRFTAYNWETNASNAGHDYFFENDDYLSVSSEPGWTVSRFLKYVQSAGAAALLTVPTLGYVSADKDTERDGGRDVSHSKDYLHTRFFKSVARKPGGHFTYPPDTTDGVVYQDEFVHWVESVKSSNTPVWYSLDNEPDFWYETHKRLQPDKPTYAEIIANNLEYAAAIKGVAPDSLIFGPVNYGWYGMRAFQGAKDANGRDFVDTYLDAVHEANKRAGKQLIDVYDFHWYPEAMGDGVRIIYHAGPDKPGTTQARIQAPRSLWDPTYIEQSWITKSLGNKAIRLLPDMMERIRKHCPGMKLAITEYEFGARDRIDGALAQADALGAFGRLGLFAACHWGLNHQEHAAMSAFKAFTDYDRRGSRFGDRALQVQGENPLLESIYAARDSNDPHRLTVVAINKGGVGSQSISLAIKGFSPRTGRGFTVQDGVYETPQSTLIVTKQGEASFVTPPLSITTVELSDR
ncbi:MAG: glycoside hydrolase family 44 protein [Fimbriimonas sp.]|nr:glycoside hydrolase family 44 protein [Fimbriimonas sp.]